MAEERRVVTVLFADLVGSTGIGETMDPEDLRQFLASYFSTAQEIIEEYGGTLEKFIGDAVMAVFGVPRAHDDDARRALAAALGLRDRLRMDPRFGDRRPIRIGINTGEVVSGVGGYLDQLLVAGDAVNVAARLQQQARPWSILCGERTIASAGGSFRFGPIRRLKARGRTTPVLARELISTQVPEASVRPFVGRESDMEQLELLARRVFSERRPWLLTIVAPPGTGKSRLVSEFIGRLQDLSPDAVVAVANCLPYGQRLTYWPLRAVLYQLIGLADEAPEAELLGAARAWLDDAGVPEAQRTAELLGATIGMAAAEPAVASELFAAWRTLFEAAAKRRPLVLVFEDLHWSSESLLDLLEVALQPRLDVPALLVAISRPELLGRRPGWGFGRRNHLTLDLAPLAAASVRAIVGHLLPSAEPHLVDQIVTRAEGNPFFAGEIVRSLIERSGSRGSEVEYPRIAEDLPDTVQATIQARLDALAPADRLVLQLGAVFGRSFEIAGVAAVSRMAAADVRASVDRLVDRDMLTIIDVGEVAARHILIRDVAYHALPRMERANAHAAAARWLSERATERDSSELIAFHYREAGLLMSAIEIAPPALPLVRQQAVVWLGRAADRALAAAASVEAAGYLQAAIELASPADLPDLYERLGDAHLQGELSADAYRRAQDLASGTNLPPNARLRILGKLLMHVTRSQGSVANRPSAEEMAHLRATATELLTQADDDRARARFLIAEAFVPFWASTSEEPGDRAAARDAASQGLAIAVRLDDADLRSAALDALTALADTWPDALGHALDRLKFQERLQLVERVDAHSMVAWCASSVGRLAEADVVSAQGLALVQAGQVPTYALHLAVWRIYTLRLLGRWDDLDEVADHAIDLWVATGRSAAAFALRGFIAALEVARARDEPERVQRFATVVREILDQFQGTWPIRRMAGFLDPEVDALDAILGDTESILVDERVLARTDYVERALSRWLDHGRRLSPDVLQTILEGAEKAGCRMLEAEIRRALGLALGDPEELRTALAVFESSDARPQMARVQIELGRLVHDEGLVQVGLDGLMALNDREHRSRVEAQMGPADQSPARSAPRPE
jgi:predicted ATPase/class 3 adenylate cyclase